MCCRIALPGSSVLCSSFAAHTAAHPAGGRPVTANDDEPSSHNQRGISGRPGPRKLGRKGLGRSGASNLPGRNMKRMLQLRYTTHAFRKRGNCGCRASTKMAKAAPLVKASSHATDGTTGVQAMARADRMSRANWGPSAAGGDAPRWDGIIHNPDHGWQRRRCGRSKRGSDRTAQPVGEPRATGPVGVVVMPRYRLGASPTTGSMPGEEIAPVAAYKPAWEGWRRWPRLEAGLKPYWGKPTVRNFRGGGGNEVHGLTAFCHDARKGCYIGSR